MRIRTLNTNNQPAGRRPAGRLAALSTCTIGAPYFCCAILLKTPCGVSPPPPVLELCDSRLQWFLESDGINIRNYSKSGSEIGAWRVQMELQGDQNEPPGGRFGTPGWGSDFGRKKRAPEGSLFKAFLMILGAFGGSKNDEKSCFLEPWCFIKKNMIFWKSCSRCSETLVFEGSGSIWEVPRTDQNRKKEVRDLQKNMFFWKQKNKRFS